MREAATGGDVFVTATGNYHVIRAQHLGLMKTGAIVCNSGNFNDELDLDAIAKLAVSKTTPRPFVESYKMKDGRSIRILAEGRLINLAAAGGHPAAVMDMSFANQALAAAHLAKHPPEPEQKGHTVPEA